MLFLVGAELAALDGEREDAVRARRVWVHERGALLAVALALLQQRHHVAHAVHHVRRQVLNSRIQSGK